MWSTGSEKSITAGQTSSGRTAESQFILFRQGHGGHKHGHGQTLGWRERAVIRLWDWQNRPLKMIQHTPHRFNLSHVDVMYEWAGLSPNSSHLRSSLPPVPAAQIEQNMLHLAFLKREQANELLLIDSNVETLRHPAGLHYTMPGTKRRTIDTDREHDGDFIIFTYNNYCLIIFSPGKLCLLYQICWLLFY